MFDSDERLLRNVFKGDRSAMNRYFDTQRRASRGEQAHDYCWGTGCVSCGCSQNGPCISHKALKPPVRPLGVSQLSEEDVDRVARRVVELMGER